MPLVNEYYVAKQCDLSVRTIRGWRLKRPKDGPPYIIVGGSIRYDTTALERWLATRKRGGDHGPRRDKPGKKAA